MPKILQFIPKPQICSICNKPVDLKIALIDRDGKPAHKECWSRKTLQEQAKKPPKTS